MSKSKDTGVRAQLDKILHGSQTITYMTSVEKTNEPRVRAICCRPIWR
jgi:hypothetical protein